MNVRNENGWKKNKVSLPLQNNVTHLACIHQSAPFEMLQAIKGNSYFNFLLVLSKDHSITLFQKIHIHFNLPSLWAGLHDNSSLSCDLLPTYEIFIQKMENYGQ